MRDFGIDLPDGPSRVAWRLNLRGAVAAVYNVAGAIEDYGMIQSPGSRNHRDAALLPKCEELAMILKVANGVLLTSLHPQRLHTF